jgi:tyrosyl-tRNA synthetase
MEAKLELARFIARRAGGQEGARRAEEHFTRVVREGKVPEEVPQAELPPDDPVHLPKLLAGLGLVGSTSEGRRLIAQGGLKVNGEAATDLDVARERLNHALLQVGKRRFVRLT